MSAAEVEVADAAAQVPRTRVIHILRRIVEDGWSHQRTARSMELPYAVVDQVVAEHGGPDKTRLAWALDELIKPDPSADPAPATDPTRPRPVFDPTAILARAMASTNPKLSARARKLEEAFKGLADDLEADKEDARVRARIAQLQAEVAELQASRADRGGGSQWDKGAGKWTPDEDGSYHCPGCPRQFGSPQAVAVHNAKAHGKPKP